jgi:murein DD-endopeptidase MepM/ murein hydrolase activator NlpD
MVFYITGFNSLSFQFGKSTEIAEQNALLEKHLQSFESRLNSLKTDVASLDSTSTVILENSDMSSVDLKGASSDISSRSDADQNATTGNLFDNISSLEKKSRTLEANVNALYSALIDKPDLIRSIPSIRPADGVISREFGISKDVATRSEKPYWGIDIHNVEGTPIVATADGIVEARAYSNEFGQYILINHGNGYKTRYCHLQTLPQMKEKIQPRIGARVKRGQQIGFMGRTGIILDVVSSHLMYSVLHNGKPVNPANFFFAQNFAAGFAFNSR